MSGLPCPTLPRLRPYQIAAVLHLTGHASEGDRALVVCPAGGGKTIIAATALADCSAPFDRIGWAANTTEQVAQAVAALDAAGVSAQWVRCVAGLTPADVADLSFFIIDECHHLMAATWHVLALACPGAVWGLTATPKTGDYERDWQFARFWRGHIHTVPRAQILAGGHLVTGHVRVIDIDQPGEFDTTLQAAADLEALKMHRRYPTIPLPEAQSRALWRVTLDLLINHPARNAVIIRIAAEEIAAGKSVLILVAEIDHGTRLAEEIGQSSIIAHSKMGAKKRREAIAAFRAGSLRCLVATSLADEGLDVPRAAVLILATPGRSAAKLEQRAGRVMRPAAGKSVGLVYDFADAGAGMAHRQHKSRLRSYRRIGYSIAPDPRFSA